MVSAASIVLQKVGVAESRCNGMGVKAGSGFTNDETIMRFSHWCRRFELAFRFTVVMV